ncbi:CYTH domain-containing protein [Streptantibioticus ferralitis]|uniref:CYTH domain-containing protein n=1 Tax=Streptantibioticus ferralitis TaxID=236510 RepID=UPI0031D51158
MKRIEVERKRQLSDGGERLAGLLVELGRQASGPVTEVDTYFSRRDVDYTQTVECLRVRQRGGSQRSCTSRRLTRRLTARHM